MILFAVIAIGCCESARAELMQFRMTGTIDIRKQVGELPAGIFQGAPFEAILSYDLTTADSQAADLQRGFYSAIGEINNFLVIRAGPSEIRSTNGLALWIGNDISELKDIWELRGDTLRMMDSNLSANFEMPSIARISLLCNDPTQSAFSSDALPIGLDALSFTDAIIDVKTFEIDNRVRQFAFHAQVHSIEVVPEPSALALASLAILLGVIFARRRIRLSVRHSISGSHNEFHDQGLDRASIAKGENRSLDKMGLIGKACREPLRGVLARGAAGSVQAATPANYRPFLGRNVQAVWPICGY